MALTDEQVDRVINEYDRLVRINGTEREVAEDQHGEVVWEVLDIAREVLRVELSDADADAVIAAAEGYKRRLSAGRLTDG